MRTCLCFFVSLSFPLLSFAEDLTPHLTFSPGPINGVLLQQQGAHLAIYGWTEKDAPKIEKTLLTSGRRDVIWKARSLVESGTSAIAPARASYWLESPGEFWRNFAKQRFHDYGQQTTKVPIRPLKVAQWAKDGDKIPWRGATFQVLETPGFSRDGISYVAEIDGKKIAFTGDLIYGDGQVLDLYSFQDAIPEAQIRGYHGYGARLAALVASLKKVQEAKPDWLVPARGPVIKQPQEAIQRLTHRVQKLYHNYLSTNALHWYFKKDRMTACGQRVLGKDASVELMPYSHHEQTPNWIFEHGTSRLIISKSGGGFLLDCGNQGVIKAIQNLIKQGLVKKVEGVFVTHYHDDHTDAVQAAAETFQCPVYATPEYADVLEKPEAYHLPAMTANPIKNVRRMKDGQMMQWREYQFTFHFFPGQTYYHGGLLVSKEKEKPVFFIGDAFAPSGMDDYCVLNRNLAHEDNGYLLCLKKLNSLPKAPWLINQHIRHVFSYDAEEMQYLENRYRQRIAIMRELFPWDDPNYGIDEQWAFFYPYGVQMKPGQKRELEIRLTNHSPKTRTFTVRPKSSGLRVVSEEVSITLKSRETKAVKVSVEATDETGLYLVTADVRSEGMEFRDWIESLVTVGD